MALMSSVGIAILTGLQAAAVAAAVNRSTSLAEVTSRNFANALDEAVYTECGSVTDYSPATLGFAPPPGTVVTVLAVGHWNGASLSVPEAQMNTAFPSGCATDKGVQRITYRVEATHGGRSGTRTQSVLKRFEGAYPEPAPTTSLPSGWQECTITSAGVRDTYVDEDASSRDSNFGSADEMHLLYRDSLRRFTYLWFDVAPGVACAEGGTLPANVNVRSVRLSLYTFNVGGAPACDGSCWHVLERVPAAGAMWSETGMTWNNQPCPTAYAVSCERDASNVTVNGRTLFPHGGRQRDALFQVVTSPSASNGTALLDDVRSFHADPTQNHGWVVKEACAQTYGYSCGTIRPGFQLRTREAAVAAERPTLSLEYRL